MVRLNIISGFLGAGKTTLINKLIKESFAEEQIVIVLNEFGETEIDRDALRDLKVSVEGLSSGCICCGGAGDFGKTVDSIIEWVCPDRIIVEPSGMAKLSDVISAIDACVFRDRIEIESPLTVVDPLRIETYIDSCGSFYTDQILSADIIMMSRTEALTPEDRDRCRALIRGYNDEAEIISTPWGDIYGEVLKENFRARSTNRRGRNIQYGKERSAGGHIGPSYTSDAGGSGYTLRKRI